MRRLLIKGVLPDDMVDNGRIPNDMDVWCINSQDEPPIWNAWFQLHGLGHIYEKHGLSGLYTLARMSRDKPVYLYGTQVDKWNKWHMVEKGSVAPAHDFQSFPIESICKHFKTRYFTGSFSLLLAYAIYISDELVQTYQGHNAKYSDIYWAGVDLWPNPRRPQYVDEHWAVPCIEYWCGVAIAHGIKVHNSPNNTGIQHDVWGGIYGYEAGGEY